MGLVGTWQMGTIGKRTLHSLLPALSDFTACKLVLKKIVRIPYFCSYLALQLGWTGWHHNYVTAAQLLFCILIKNTSPLPADISQVATLAATFLFWNKNPPSTISTIPGCQRRKINYVHNMQGIPRHNFLGSVINPNHGVAGNTFNPDLMSKWKKRSSLKQWIFFWDPDTTRLSGKCWEIGRWLWSGNGN